MLLNAKNPSMVHLQKELKKKKKRAPWVRAYVIKSVL